MQRLRRRDPRAVTSPSGITVTSDPPVGSFAMGQFFGQAALPFTGTTVSPACESILSSNVALNGWLLSAAP